MCEKIVSKVFEVLDPILAMSGGVADTFELFLRNYQMLQMFRVEDRQA